MYDIENRIIETAEYIASTKCTVRDASKHFGISKSTVHKDMSERLVNVNANLYEEISKILKYNKKVRHIRGGEATKRKYLSIKETNDGK